MKKIITCIFIFCISINLFATGQISDTLIYFGKKYSLRTFPLETYFKQNPKKRPITKLSCTGLWRNYIATFVVIHNQIILKDIKIMYVSSASTDTKYKSVINEIFPGEKNIKAYWFTGLLEVGVGEQVLQKGRGYGSVDYDNYIIIEVNKGNIVKEKKFSYEQYNNFKEVQFQAFKKTNEYTKADISLKKHHINGRDQLMQEYILEYTNKFLID